MKKLFALLFMSVVIFACSSDDDSNDPGGSGGQESLTFTINGEDIEITSWQAFRREKDFAITGSGANGRNIALEFNRLGNLNYVATYSTSDLTIPYMSSYYFFSSFELKLVLRKI